MVNYVIAVVGMMMYVLYGELCFVAVVGMMMFVLYGELSRYGDVPDGVLYGDW